MRRPRLASPMAASALALATLAGCAQHGTYTREHISNAQAKMALMKSGTEWNMAHQQFLAGDLDKAIRSVDNSIALNPEVPKAHLLRGRIQMERGRLEEARESLLRAAELDPTNAEPQYFLGLVHERFRQSEAALERFTAACDLDKSNPQYAIAATEMLIQLNRIDDAEAFLVSRQEAFQFNAAVRHTRAHVAQLRGDYPRAAELLVEARLLAPDDTAILEDLIMTLIACGQFAEAEFNTAKLLELPDHSTRRDLKHIRAMCLQRIDRPVEARTILVELTSSKEGAADVGAWIQLGNVAATLRDSVRLRTAASRVIALAPDRYEGHFLRALSLHRAGSLPEALAAADRAAQISKVDSGPLVLRGIILQDMGRTGDAVTSLSQAVERNPSDRAAKSMLQVVKPGAAVASHPVE